MTLTAILGLHRSAVRDAVRAMTARERLALVTGNGVRFPITGGGVVIGRGARCDLVLDGVAVSRVQAILYADPDGCRLVVLGRAPTRLNGRVVDGTHALDVGDVVELDAVRYEIASDGAEPAAPAAAWMIRDASGQRYGLTRTAFVVGGGPRAALRIAGWPDEVLTFVVADRLHVEASVDLEVAGRAVAAGELAVLELGQRVVVGDRWFEVIAGGAVHGAATAGARGLPDRALLELLPRGGRLILGWRDDEQAIYLPERRCELIALLLQPPAPYAAGELIPDEVLRPRLRGERPLSRVELNVIIHRARRDLVRSGLDGALLIERAPGGVATRFALEHDARVGVL